ncbi:MAG: high-potential iron-sulfur protein [Rhodothermales bacterium]
MSMQTDDPRAKAHVTVSRRGFVRRISVLAGASLAGSVVLSACEGERPPIEPQEDPPRTAVGEIPESVTSECPGFEDVDEQTVHLRQVLNYSDESPQEEQYCSNCRFFEGPTDDETCGECRVLQSPVHPEGYCYAWASRDV